MNQRVENPPQWRRCVLLKNQTEFRLKVLFIPHSGFQYAGRQKRSAYSSKAPLNEK
jgi:hypothetical protein